MNQNTQITFHQLKEDKRNTDSCVNVITPEVQEVNEDLRKVVETEVLDI